MRRAWPSPRHAAAARYASDQDLRFAAQLEQLGLLLPWNPNPNPDPDPNPNPNPNPNQACCCRRSTRSPTTGRVGRARRATCARRPSGLLRACCGSRRRRARRRCARTPRASCSPGTRAAEPLRCRGKSARWPPASAKLRESHARGFQFPSYFIPLWESYARVARRARAARAGLREIVARRGTRMDDFDDAGGIAGRWLNVSPGASPDAAASSARSGAAAAAPKPPRARSSSAAAPAHSPSQRHSGAAAAVSACAAGADDRALTAMLESLSLTHLEALADIALDVLSARRAAPVPAASTSAPRQPAAQPRKPRAPAPAPTSRGGDELDELDARGHRWSVAAGARCRGGETGQEGHRAAQEAASKSSPHGRPRLRAQRRRGMSASALRRGTAPLPHRVHRVYAFLASLPELNGTVPSGQTSARVAALIPPPPRCSAATTARTIAATTAATTSACPRSSAPEVGSSCSSCSFRPLAPVSQLATWPPTTLSGSRPRARCEMLQSG
eukprot:scaffold7099_cov62-Phaeocystis_antarctica.AAC.1